MVHIVDGALSTPVVIAGGVVALAGTAIGLRKTDPDKVPHVGVMSATFFVASLVNLPLPPSSVHLVLNGLIGVLLGWAAFPAVLTALLLQAVFFGFGGLTALGVNAVNVAVPALVVHYVCTPGLRRAPRAAAAWGAVAGALAVALTAVMVAGALAASGQAFLPAAQLVLVSHLPVMVVEAVVTAAACSLIRKAKPELLGVGA